MQVPIQSIVTKERVRRDAGDLSSLRQSLATVGQLTPILLTRDYELVAGFRRLAAARELAWQTIDATFIERDSPIEKLQMELDENLYRKDFTEDERVAGFRRLEELKKPKLIRGLRRFFGGIGAWFARIFGRGKSAARRRDADETSSYLDM